MIDRFVDIGGIDDHHCLIIQLKINNITQEKSEAVNQRRTDNAMEKRINRQTMINETLHRKLKIQQHEPH